MSIGEQDVPIRIIKKKKGGHGGHHGGAWKVAYADFVTAMMALFIVLWIVGQSKQVKQYVAYYFKDPGAFSETTKNHGILEGGGKEIVQDAAMGDLVRTAQEAELKKMGEQIMGELAKNEEIKVVLDQIKIEIVKEGMRIEMMESKQSVFFDVGTSKMKNEASEILATIARQIKSLNNKVIVEGHTDARPYSNDLGYTNFELSAERANSARRVLVAGGVRTSQIEEVRGYADSHLRNPADPMDASNRRISIIIKFQEK